MSVGDGICVAVLWLVIWLISKDERLESLGFVLLILVGFLVSMEIIK